jgi:hypothetical protein
MTQDDHDVFATMGSAMAASNGYVPEQSSELYITDGSLDDWAYANYKIFMFTFEMGGGSFYPAGSQIPALTSINAAAVRYLLEQSDCPYRVIGKEATYCSPTRLGDVNNDGLANSTDALIVLSGSAGIDTKAYCPMNCGDVNADGFVNATDALIILSYSAGMTVPYQVGVEGVCPAPASVTPCPGCQ